MLSERKLAFIRFKALGHSNIEAYVSAAEIEGEKCSKETARANGFKWAQELCEEIQAEIKNQLFFKQEQNIDEKLRLIEKVKEIEENRDLLDKGMRAKSSDIMKIAKNPVLFNATLIAGILRLLFTELKLADDGKTLAIAEPDKEAWIAMPWMKDLIARNLLNGQMFDAKVKNPPAIANQVNVNLNK
jgi:hypothetical protein